MSNFVTRWVARRIFESSFVGRRIFENDPDFVVGPITDPYLWRWYVIPRNRFFNVYLHLFLKSDDDRALHDHPWWSMSLTLYGRMVEQYRVPGECNNYRVIQAGDVTWRSAKFAHILSLAPGERAATLFITGPVIRNWGFHCPKGWKPWREFCAPGDKGNIGRGCDE